MALDEEKNKTGNAYLDYCKNVLTGRIREKNGRPITELNRLQCLHVLNQKVAMSKQATTLFSFINGLQVKDKTRHQIEHSTIYTPLMARQAEIAFITAAASDILSGRLVVRDPVHLLRQNETPEVKSVMSDPDHADWFSISVRLVVTLDDARSWLQWHGRPIPDWLKVKKEPSEKRGLVIGSPAHDAMELMRRLAVLEYGYDPADKRSDATRFIYDDTNRIFKVDRGTVLTWLRRANGLVPVAGRQEVHESVLKIILGMVESRFKYPPDKLSTAVADCLRQETWPYEVSQGRIASILDEAMLLPRKGATEAALRRSRHT